jgi:UDP-N-acetylmuramyl pentapeptide phosphotransferase/UDP-N-acetylglucosamine-1-phosphate transferase
MNFIELFIVFFLLCTVSIIYLKIARKLNIVDKPNNRSSHTKTTVRGGGIVFPTAILLFFFLNDYQYQYFVLGVFLISVISFLDDIYALSPKIRFFFQFIAVCLVLFEVGLTLDPIYVFVIYLVAGIGFVNMFNFMDGINGITGFYSLTVLSGLFFINRSEHLINEDLIVFSAVSLFIFGFYNFRKKALFFAGDIGSISIGILIFFIGLYLTYELNSPMVLLLIIVYGADVCNTLLYRKFLTRESVFEPHRHHIYQKLVDVKKMSHLKVSAIYSCIQFIVNIIIYKTYNIEMQTQFLIFIILVSIFTLFYIYLFRKLTR